MLCQDDINEKGAKVTKRLLDSTAIIQIDPDPTLAINQGPLMGAIIFRKREHLFERQRVVRTLKMIALMGPIARVGSGSIRTRHTTWLPKVSLRSLVAALCRDDTKGLCRTK